MAEIYGLKNSVSEQALKELSSKKEITKTIKELKKKMKKSAEEMDFESAVKFRDQIKSLELKELELS